MRPVLAALALSALTACGGALTPGGEGAPVGAQSAHPNGTVLQVRSLTTSGERTLVNVRVLNGRDREIRLASRPEQSYILTDSGEKLPLADSPTNPGLAVPQGRMMDGALVFTGELPSAGRATLVLNATDGAGNRFSSTPRFEIALPLDGARGSGIPEASGLSAMRPLPASRLAAAAPAGSSLGQAAGATSTLSQVQALKSELGAVETERGTLVSLPGDVTFDFDKATIQPRAEPTLTRLAQLIAASTGTVTIEGHTDARGDDSYNRRLSEQRAESVKAWLAGKGVPATRLTTIGLGELRPVAPNATATGQDDEAGRARNRRVEVILPKTNADPPM